MQICGLNKTTLLDYPEHVAATVFLAGCNFRCPFCHNGNLVLSPSTQPSIPVEEILSFLKKRSNILTGVCITGGEPTLSKELPVFIKSIKDLGFKVKLDTNGSRPEVLASLLKEQLLDYIAMDIKGDKAHYGMITGLFENGFPDLSSIETSITLIKSSGIPYEFRTTVIKEFHNKEAFEGIGHWLHGSQKYFLQNFENSPQMLVPDSDFHSYGKEELIEFSRLLAPHFAQVGIRGID